MGRIAASVCLLIVGLGGLSAIAQEAAPDNGPKIDPAAAEEIKYAEGLNKLGLSYYADIVISKIKGNDGGLRTVAEIKSKVGMKKFAEALAIVAKQPDQDSQPVWAMKLTVADGYYGWGMYTNAQAIYQSFFKKFPDGPPATLSTFYVSSGYKYAQMMLLTGQDEAALGAYRATLKATNHMERAEQRQILAEMSELMVKISANPKTPADEQKALMEEASRICKDVLMWVQDVWFGKAIALLAHIKMLQGDVDGSQKLVEENWDILKQIDDMLRQDASENPDLDLLKISPLANCHYTLGVMMQTEGEKLLAAGTKDKALVLLMGKPTGATDPKKPKRTMGALHHLMTVFADYSATSWAPDAGARGQKLLDLLRSLGVDIKITISPQKLKEIEIAQFQQARTLFLQQKWRDAADAYERVLNLYPESETAVACMADLATCYFWLEDYIFADMIVHHLAQRFGGDSPLMAMAGDQVLRMATFFNDSKKEEAKEGAYAQYFNYFPKHSRMPAVLYSFGSDKLKVEDYAGALAYFDKITTRYTNSTPYFDAMSRSATCYEKMGDRTNEVRVLETLIPRLEKSGSGGVSAIRARYQLAVALRAADPTNNVIALGRFNDLVKILSDAKRPYQGEEKEVADRVLEGSLYYKAMCYTSTNTPEDKVAEYRKNAIDGFTSLATRFPKSPYTPSALQQAGTLWTVVGDSEEAAKSFRKLQKDYPDSPEAKNADFLFAMALLNLGKRVQAVEAFKRMFEGSEGKYSDTQIRVAGEELVKAKEYEIAHMAFAKVLGTTKDPRIKELLLLRDGQALLEMGNAEGATKSLETLFKLFPRSAYTIDAAFFLSRAYTEMGAKEADEKKRSDYFTLAVQAMIKASSYEKTPDGRLRIDLAVARMWILRAKAEEQFGGKEGPKHKDKAVGCYQTIILLNSPDKVELRPFIEDAYNECIPLLFEQQNWLAVTENASKYLTAFPNGKYEGDIRRWRNRARMNIPGSGQETPEQEEAPPVPDETPVPDVETPAEGETAPAPAPETAAPVVAEPPAKPAVAPVAKPATNKPPAAVQGTTPPAKPAVKPAGTNAPAAKPVTAPAVKPAAKPVVKPPTAATTSAPPAKVQAPAPTPPAAKPAGSKDAK